MHNDLDTFSTAQFQAKTLHCSIFSAMFQLNITTMVQFVCKITFFYIFINNILNKKNKKNTGIHPCIEIQNYVRKNSYIKKN